MPNMQMPQIPSQGSGQGPLPDWLKALMVLMQGGMGGGGEDPSRIGAPYPVEGSMTSSPPMFTRPGGVVPRPLVQEGRGFGQSEYSGYNPFRPPQIGQSEYDEGVQPFRPPENRPVRGKSATVDEDWEWDEETQKLNPKQGGQYYDDPGAWNHGQMDSDLDLSRISGQELIDRLTELMNQQGQRRMR